MDLIANAVSALLAFMLGAAGQRPPAPKRRPEISLPVKTLQNKRKTNGQDGSRDLLDPSDSLQNFLRFTVSSVGFQHGGFVLKRPA